jgi:hypothetical protein
MKDIAIIEMGDESIRIAFEKEPVNFLLVNALKYLTEDQRKQLYNALGERLPHDLTDIEREARERYPDEEGASMMRNIGIATQRNAYIDCAKQFIDKVRGLEKENAALREEIECWKDELKDRAREHRTNK